MAARKKPTPPLIEGRIPPELPNVNGALAPLVEELRAIEALAVDPKTMFPANQRRAALIDGARDGSRSWPAADVRRLIDEIGFDLGERPESVDYSKAHTRPQMKKLDEAFQALLLPSLAREETFKVLVALAAVDLAIQAELLARIPSLPRGVQLHARLFEAIAGSRALADATLEELRARVRSRDLPVASVAAWALFQQGPARAYAEIAPALGAVEKTSQADLEYAKAVIDAGTAHWPTADRAWREVLAPFAALKDVPYDFNRINLWRAETQLGASAATALAALAGAAAKPRAPAAPPAQPAQTGRVERTPIDRKKLGSARARELALDALADWFVEEVASAPDDEQVRAVMRGAITSFYDVREAAEQERGEYAGHFFMVDAVGLDDTGRAVPWTRLRERLSEERMERLTALFEEAEAQCE